MILILRSKTLLPRTDPPKKSKIFGTSLNLKNFPKKYTFESQNFTGNPSVSGEIPRLESLKIFFRWARNIFFILMGSELKGVRVGGHICYMLLCVLCSPLPTHGLYHVSVCVTVMQVTLLFVNVWYHTEGGPGATPTPIIF